MIEFHEVSLSDKKWIKEILSTQREVLCENSFGNIFSYKAVYSTKVANVYGTVVVKYELDGFTSYCFPIGCGNKKLAVEFIISDCEENGTDVILFNITKKDKAFLIKEFPETFVLEEDRDGGNYIYSFKDLSELKGKKYQPKRNHISFFEKNYNWTYEKITEENILECVEMSKLWLEESEGEYKNELEDEFKIITLTAENFFALDYIGALIRIDGKVVAYTMGEELTKDSFCVHFEKAFPDIRGAYPMINREFVKNELSLYRFINREDDVGKENLRKAKLSYHPYSISEQYIARIKK